MGNQQKPKEKNCRITMFEEYEHVSYNSTRTFTTKKKDAIRKRSPHDQSRD